MDWFDKEEFYCKECKQGWVLTSNNFINTKQHNEWLIRAVKEHNKNCTNRLNTIEEIVKEDFDEDNFN